MGIIEFLANIQHFGMELPIDFKYKKLHLSATYFSSVEIMPQGDKDYNDEFLIHRNDMTPKVKGHQCKFCDGTIYKFYIHCKYHKMYNQCGI